MNDIYSWNPIRVPVKLVDGNWEFFYGGGIPVKDGTVGDLLISKAAITDKKFLASLKKKSTHKILDVNTELLVALTIKQKPDLDNNLSAHLMSYSHPDIKMAGPSFYKLLSPDTRFVKITMAGPTKQQKSRDPDEQGGVWLHLEGLQPKGIVTSTIKLPEEVTADFADSLNHAFTLLSEKYEPWRKSHTGNIYNRIFYREKNNQWYPLNILRNATVAKDEHQLINDRWKIIMEVLKLKID